jgi:hypothetical protein
MDRKSLLESFDGLQKEVDVEGTLAGMDAFKDRALATVTSNTVRNALDIDKEDPKIRDRYGDAQDLLNARRLIEAGVGFVTAAVPLPVPNGDNSPRDTHTENFDKLRRSLPPHLDKGVATLVEDLHERGLDQTKVTLGATLFVAGTHYSQRRLAPVRRPEPGPKCYPKMAPFEPRRSSPP